MDIPLIVDTIQSLDLDIAKFGEAPVERLFCDPRLELSPVKPRCVHPVAHLPALLCLLSQTKALNARPQYLRKVLVKLELSQWR